MLEGVGELELCDEALGLCDEVFDEVVVLVAPKVDDDEEVAVVA